MRYTKRQVRDIVVEQTKLADEQIVQLGKEYQQHDLYMTFVSVGALLVGMAYGFWMGLGF